MIDMSGASVDGTMKLIGEGLDGANFTNMIVQSPSRFGPSFAESSLNGCDFSGSFLPLVDFRHCKMDRVCAVGAKWSGADLRWASLQRASLIDADLSGADLRWSALFDADLRGADLTGAILGGAYFEGARYDARTVFPAGFDLKGAGMRFVAYD